MAIPKEIAENAVRVSKNWCLLCLKSVCQNKYFDGDLLKQLLWSHLVLGAALNTRASFAAVSGLSSDGRLPWEKGERSDEVCSRMLELETGVWSSWFAVLVGPM